MRFQEVQMKHDLFTDLQSTIRQSSSVDGSSETADEIHRDCES